MKQRSSARLGPLIGAILLLFFAAPSPFARAPRENPILRALTEQRNAFVQRASESGLPCRLPPARLELTQKASLGGYDPKTNVLRTSTWRLLNPKGRTIYYQLAGPGAGEAEARRVFENEAHRWMLVHELGHWWQACRQANSGRSHFEIEYDAERIAAAYWRETDPGLMDKRAEGFRQVLKGMPVQLPAGETPERYFNEHFAEVTASASTNLWFQAFLISSVEAEDPLPTLGETLAEDQPATSR